MNIPKWLKIARELHSISQVGLEHAHGGYDTERYERLREISAEIIVAKSTLTKEEVLKSFAMQPGYITPKVDVRAAVFRDEQILLVQEANDHHWSLPGGWADVGDTPSEAIIREVREESGFNVRAIRVVGVYDANRVPKEEMMPFYHAFKLLFLCEIIDGEARPSHETPDVGFFSLADLPPLSLYRTNQGIIEDAFSQKKNLAQATHFD